MQAGNDKGVLVMNYLVKWSTDSKNWKTIAKFINKDDAFLFVDSYRYFKRQNVIVCNVRTGQEESR